MSRTSTLLLIALFAAPTVVDAKLKGKDCEVCIKVLNKVVDQVKNDGKEITDTAAIESATKTFCKKAKGKGSTVQVSYLLELH